MKYHELSLFIFVNFVSLETLDLHFDSLTLKQFSHNQSMCASVDLLLGRQNMNNKHFVWIRITLMY